ncbi:hypothetical protein HH_0892 [Helicobacter hepaticus ATCC 51449]|uniref:Uncharacterized protein n=1 Tax=Helicobacter hepaticus (strain ATCC 51449 / 3B1) TaxID=235279 RepID=Q7VHS1_HELHP|nr:hypothetical protein HH_0892 [Helicobacter hepaticus ATCC 51449]
MQIRKLIIKYFLFFLALKYTKLQHKAELYDDL